MSKELEAGLLELHGESVFVDSLSLLPCSSSDLKSLAIIAPTVLENSNFNSLVVRDEHTQGAQVNVHFSKEGEVNLFIRFQEIDVTLKNDEFVDFIDGLSEQIDSARGHQSSSQDFLELFSHLQRFVPASE